MFSLYHYKKIAPRFTLSFYPKSDRLLAYMLHQSAELRASPGEVRWTRYIPVSRSPSVAIATSKYVPDAFVD